MLNRDNTFFSIQRTVAALFCLLMAVSCKNTKSNDDANAAKGDFVAERNFVDTMRLRRSDFNREVISNGNLRAVRKADLVFKTQGEIARVFKENGNFVKKGDTIAVLNTDVLQLRLQQSEQNMEKARLDFADNLIGFGYGKDTANVPKEVIKVAGIRSGYFSAEHDLASARLDISNAAVVAPFNGVIANLSAKPYEQSKEVICSVIDASAFDVNFNLLESELSYIRPGQDVKIVPFIEQSESYTGKIRQINPMIDDKGQVKIVAGITNKSGKLMEGMNVKIFIRSTSHDRLVVPKSAVVIRDGYDVLFTLDPETLQTGWVYVDILESNSTHHVVQENKQKNAHLSEGDIIVISGNLNLADGSRVEIKK